MVQTSELCVPPVDVPLIISYPDVDLSRKGKRENMDAALETSLQRGGVSATLHPWKPALREQRPPASPVPLAAQCLAQRGDSVVMREQMGTWQMDQAGYKNNMSYIISPINLRDVCFTLLSHAYRSNDRLLVRLYASFLATHFLICKMDD